MRQVVEKYTQVWSGHDAGRWCHCVSNHVPSVIHIHRHHIVPFYMGGEDLEDNLVWLCPTTHENVHVLLRHYHYNNGTPPWDILRTVGPYGRELARLGWEGREQ